MDSNADSVQYKSKEILICGKAENKLLKNTPHLPDLVGYVKDLAWEYEHEVRVLATVDKYGKRHTPSKSTGLTVKGNKKRAEKMLSEARAAKEAELEARAIESSTGKAPVGTILFTAFLLDWLEMTKKNVEETTYGAYSMTIKSKINPYFEEHHPGLALCEVTPKHIQDYYTYELTVRGVSANTVIHRHANIRKALQHAFKLGLIDSNPADRIERPKKEKFVGNFYEEDALNHLFEVVRGDPIELGVILGAFYGLRRSEAVGLKKDCVCQCDFGRISLRMMPYVPPMSLLKSACKRQIC